MSRKRAPEHDFICRRCGCPCDPVPGRHLGGGRGMRACSGPSQPVLRSAFDAEVTAVIRGYRLS